MIFVIWADHDSARVNGFDEDSESASAEELIANLLAKDGKYGTEILAVICGDKIEYEVVEKVKSVRIKQ